MRTILRFCSKLKYLGLLGLPMFFSDLLIWKYMWLFWLFGILEIALTFPVFLQQLYQIAGMLFVAVKNIFSKSGQEIPSEIVYSLPFQGEWLVVNGGVNKELSHSWELNSQRYAYDFVMIDSEMNSFLGDSKTLTSYYCYGKDILSPADGKVIKVYDKCKESEIMPNHTTDPLIRDIRGNYIVIQHAKNEYSVLAHLKRGSITVKEGEIVKRLQKIAQCGNSGNTSEPHLHFQIQNGKSFFYSEGKKIRFGEICRVNQPNYEKFDSRDIIKDEKTYIEENYIHRGMAVKNVIEK